jgi:hypothetical protein
MASLPRREYHRNLTRLDQDLAGLGSLSSFWWYKKGPDRAKRLAVLKLLPGIQGSIESARTLRVE